MKAKEPARLVEKRLVFAALEQKQVIDSPGTFFAIWQVSAGAAIPSEAPLMVSFDDTENWVRVLLKPARENQFVTFEFLNGEHFERVAVKCPNEAGALTVPVNVRVLVGSNVRVQGNTVSL